MFFVFVNLRRIYHKLLATVNTGVQGIDRPGDKLVGTGAQQSLATAIVPSRSQGININDVTDGVDSITGALWTLSNSVTTYISIVI